MKQVDIKIFTLAQTQVNRDEVQRWLEHLEVEPEFIDEMLETGEEVSDPALLVALAAKRCYKSFQPGLNPNVTRVRRDLTEYLDNVMKQRHGSVLEHSVYTFAMEGVSRVFTAEMNRHRAGVGVSEASMRYIRYTDIPFWMPDSIKFTEAEFEIIEKLMDEEGDHEENSRLPLWDADLSLLSPEARMALKKWRTQELFKKAFIQDEENYKAFQEIWKDELNGPDFKDKKHLTSCGRRIIPMGVATGGVWTMNIRAMRHIIALRASPAAEEEMIHVFSRLIQLVKEREPMFFGDFTQTPEGYWVPKYDQV